MDSWTPHPAGNDRLPLNWEERSYAIEIAGPPDRQGWISWEPFGSLDGQQVEPKHGWRIVLQVDDQREPLRSTWEEFFFEILRYPPVFGFPLSGWRQEWDGAIVDLAVLQPFIDGKSAGPDDTPEEVGLR